MIHLVRIDHTQNMARFYRMTVEPDLFGGVTLTTEWGRIGQSGTIKTTLFADGPAAEVALAKQARAKQRRGYQQPQHD